jgi:hypothetical protein
MSTKPITYARAQLHARQNKYPPIYALNSRGLDRGRALAGVLFDALPPELRSLQEKDQIAVGEVGEFNPIVATYPVEEQQFSIEITTGLMDFYYAIGRALGGAISIYTTSANPTVQATLRPDQVTEYVAEVFRQWREFRQQNWISKTFKALPRIQRPDFSIDQRSLNIIENLITGAELFMIAHEFGHVAIDRKLVDAPNEEDEMSADSLGLDFFVPAMMNKQFGLRKSFASAAFAIRIVAGLERIGVVFPKVYPPADKRLDNIRQRFAATYCPSEQYFDEASTIMVNYQDILDDVDNRIKPASAPAVPDDWRTRVRIIAEIQEVACGRLPPERFARDLHVIAAKRPESSMSAIIGILRRYYIDAVAPRAFLPLDMRSKMGEVLKMGLKSANTLKI